MTYIRGKCVVSWFALVLSFIIPVSSTWAVTFTTNTSIDANNAGYDGQDIVVDNCTLTIDGQHSFNGLHVIHQGKVTHSAATAGMYLIIAQDFAIDNASSLSATGKGYGPATGPGKGEAGYAGGGYGGRGGLGYQATTGGSAYGSITEPVDLGSGGGTDTYYGIPGGTGGGSIRLSVGGTLTVTGRIEAEGTSAPPAGGGSGGSLYLSVGTLAGAGTISVNGGNDAGGGGRIAIYFDTSTFTGAILAYGKAGYNSGGAGTIYTKATSQPSGDVRIDNNGTVGGPTPLLSALPSENLWITGNAVAYSIEPLNLASLRVTNGSQLNQQSGQSALTITVSGDMMIDNTSFVSAAGKGYGPAAGPGKGTALGVGGGYGGAGSANYQSVAGGAAYGSITEPVDPGSGGGTDYWGGSGGAGGGAIRLSVGGTLTVNGRIDADGATVGAAGGGSGGSIYLSVVALDGTGTISANGANQGGGGGRIAIYFGANNFAGLTTAYGNAGQGGAGTIYTKSSSQAHGDVQIDNNGAAGGLTPILSAISLDALWITGKAFVSCVEGLTVSSLHITNGGQLVPAGSPTLQVSVSGNVEVSGGSILGNDNLTRGGETMQLSVLGSVELRDGGLILGNDNLTVNGDMTIDNTSSLSATGTGYGASAGPGKGADGYYAGGGGYGGGGGAAVGGSLGGIPYGWIAEPVDLGSGGGNGLYAGGGAGGGAIRLSVGGTLSLDGRIETDGAVGQGGSGGQGGGGSGGSVWLSVGRLIGTGTISAKGGSEQRQRNVGGGGGGGRIALYCEDFAGFNTTNIYVSGGAGYEAGHEGTFYMGSTNPPPTVTDVTPDHALNDGRIANVQIVGDRFAAGATVKLTRTGQPVLSADNITVDNATHITCSFDLTRRGPGVWNVVVINPDGLIGVLPGGFTVQSTGSKVAAWGSPNYGECDVPFGNDFTDVAAGSTFSVALKSDGSLVGWGDNTSEKTNVPGGHDFVAVAAGEAHGVALKRDGSLVAWGDNSSGQCSVPAGNDFVAIAAGGRGNHSVALRANGFLRAWGLNDANQCRVPAENNYIAVAAGGKHCVALRSDGSLVAWGLNDNGQITVPTGHDFTGISAGFAHSLALRTNGTLVAWGNNDYGQGVAPGDNSSTAIASGCYFNVALRADGTLTAWGDMLAGGSIAVPPGSNYLALAAGWKHALALKIPGPVSRIRPDNTTIDYVTIQSAIDAAVDNDTVMVFPGTYTGPGNRDLTFRGKAITLTSLDPSDPQNVAATIIDCQGSETENHRGIKFTSGETPSSIMTGITIIDGFSSSNGGAVWCIESSPLISNCVLRNNRVKLNPYQYTLGGLGGGLYSEGGNPVIRGCTFDNNTACHGGGIYLDGGTIDGCTVCNNQTYSGINQGSSASQLKGGGNGAGIYCAWGFFPILINASSIIGNSTGAGQNGHGGNGAGIYFDISGDLMELRNCTLTNNRTGDGGLQVPPRGQKRGRGGDGAGIYIYGATPRIDNCTIQANQCGISPEDRTQDGTGGGICQNDVFFYMESPTTIASSLIQANSPNGIQNMSDLDLNELVQIEGRVRLEANDWVGDARNLQVSGPGELQLMSAARFDVGAPPGYAAIVACDNVTGTGRIHVPAGQELIVEGNANVNLPGDNATDTPGIQADGLFHMRGSAVLRNSRITVARLHLDENVLASNNVITAEAGSPYGQFFIEDTVTVADNEIHADGDRYMDLDPAVLNQTILRNKIYVTITEGKHGTRGGLLELRGQDPFPGQYDNQSGIIPASIPDFSIQTWTLEELKLEDNAKVTLTNRFDFGNGGASEVLNVKRLVLGSNSVLNTAYNRLYYSPGALVQDPTAQIKNEPCLGFSLNNITCDNEDDFNARVLTNNYYDKNPDHPGRYDRIHVRRVAGSPDDPDNQTVGMMRMENLIDNDTETHPLIHARAKGLFAKVSPDENQIMITFEYLFGTAGADIKLEVYLSDVAPMQDLDNRTADDNDTRKVAELFAPPAGRPGSFGSGQFAVFQQYVPRTGLDFIKGTRIELVLVGPEHSVVLIHNWDPQVHCSGIYCGDVTGDKDATEEDFLTVVGELGQPAQLKVEAGQADRDLSCLDSVLGKDGYVDASDAAGYDWRLAMGAPLSLCGDNVTGGELPLVSLDGGSVTALAAEGTMAGTSIPAGPLVVLGKLGSSLADGLCGVDASGRGQGAAAAPPRPRVNVQLVQDPAGGLYAVNLADGLVRLSDGVAAVPPGSVSVGTEPRHPGRPATVRIGLFGTGSQTSGRPLRSAAFGSTSSQVYVVPVVVVPSDNISQSYLAAAKLQLLSNGSPPYQVLQLYDEPPLAHDNQFRNYLKEVAVDNSTGTVYITNSHRLNASDILWSFSSGGSLLHRQELQNLPGLSGGLASPVGLYVSGGKVYLASSLANPDNASTQVQVLSASTLAWERTVMINGMGHVTAMTADPATGTVWVTGFTMSNIPDRPDPNQPAFYRPYLASIPSGAVGPVAAVPIANADNLSLPLSVVWQGQGSSVRGDCDGDGEVTSTDLSIVLATMDSQQGDAAWDGRADVNGDGAVTAADLQIVLAAMEGIKGGDCDGDGHVTAADVVIVLTSLDKRPGGRGLRMGGHQY